jgi:hypothetical protein
MSDTRTPRSEQSGTSTNINVPIGTGSHETGATFDSPAGAGGPIPDSPGVNETPGSQHNTQQHDPTPLSQDVDPIREFEDPEDFSKSAPLVPGRADSPSAAADAGLDTESDQPTDPLNYSESANYHPTITPDPLDEEAFALESADLDADLDAPLVEEIPMGNLDVESVESTDNPAKATALESPELDAPERPAK